MNLRICTVLAFLPLLILSCKNSDREIEKSIVPSETNSSREYIEDESDSMPEKTTDQSNFKGVGTEPFWSVEIEDKKIFFQSLNENFEAISGQVNKVDVAGDTMTFISETANETIEVTLIKEDCSDGMSDRNYSHRVEVSITRSSEKEPLKLKGCGWFLEN